MYGLVEVECYKKPKDHLFLWLVIGLVAGTLLCLAGIVAANNF